MPVEDSDCDIARRLVDAYRHSCVLGSEVVDHDENGGRPHQRLLNAEEDVGCSNRPPVFGENYHEGERDQAHPAEEDGPLAPYGVAEHTGEEVEHRFRNAEEDEVRCSRCEFFGDKGEHLRLLFAVGLGLDPSNRLVGLATHEDGLSSSWKRTDLLHARGLACYIRHGESGKLLNSPTHEDEQPSDEELERMRLELAPHIGRRLRKGAILTKSHPA